MKNCKLSTLYTNEYTQSFRNEDPLVMFTLIFNYFIFARIPIKVFLNSNVNIYKANLSVVISRFLTWQTVLKT